MKELILAMTMLFIGVVAAGAYFDGRMDEWEDRVVQVQTLAEAYRIAGDSARARADALEDSVAARDTVIARRNAEMAELAAAIDTTPVPPSCELYTGPRDELISKCKVQVADLTKSLDDQRAAADELRKAEAAAVARGDSLSAVLDDRPKPRPGWLPSIELGPFAGVCSDGQFCYGAGIALGWEVF